MSNVRIHSFSATRAFRRSVVAALFVTLMLWAAAPAQAQSIKILYLTCKDIDSSGAKKDDKKKDDKKKKKDEKKKKKKKGKRPFFVAEIQSDAGESKPKEFKIEQTDLDEPVSIVAERVVSYKNSDDPISLVVLVQGDELWMGNETYKEDDKDKMPGAFSALGGAINALIQDAPKNSKGALIVYGGSAAKVKYPMGPIKDLATGLGTQKGYQGVSGVPLIPGLAEAVSVLSKRGGRRILVVIGDGDTQVADVAKSISTQKGQLKSKGIETYVIHYATDKEDEIRRKDRLNSLATETRNRFAADQAGNFANLAKLIQTRIANRIYVYFPTTGFKLDGKPHEMQITFKDEAPEDKRVNFCLYVEKKKAASGSLWWLWLLLIVFLFLIIVVLILKRKPAEAEYEEEEYYEPEPDHSAPAPAKTMMLGMGGSDDGMPIVGWIVPLNGNNKYQTFKLLAGATTIGSDADEAQIIIGDQYMSSQHAQIVCGPQGFILLDKGSANGCYVMEKRITEHDLVDNDTFTLGKTDFKFKSIN